MTMTRKIRQPARTARRRTIRTRRRGRVRPLKPLALFPGLGSSGRAFGTGVLIAVAECQGGKPTVRVIRRESFSKRAGEGPRARLMGMVDESELATVLAGMAQRHRVGVLKAILSGANTHAGLATRTGLAAGPLYHHLRSLERAGLVTFVERNRYDVSSLGRLLILLGMVACATLSRGTGLSAAKSNVP